MDFLGECLKKDEGYRDYCYPDSKGLMTGGYGHHFVLGGHLSDEIWEAIFRYDVARAADDYTRIDKHLRDCLNKARARVIVCMIFNMGLPKVLQFRDMWVAIDKRDWGAARAAGLDSKWHTDVGERAERLMDILYSGIWPGEDDGGSV